VFYFDGIKGWLPLGCVWLDGLAYGASLDVVGDEFAKFRPPVVLAEQLTGFKNSGVPHSGGIVVQ
jgi:hypothetical protein